MAKIRVKVKPGQVLSLVDGKHKAGDELMMEEKEAKPLLGSCLSKVQKKKKKPVPTKPKPIKDEKETISG